MLALSSLQLFRKFLPLILMPYLARVLQPAGLGLVAFVQGFAALITLVVQFGFEISGTREVARWREAKERRAAVLGGVMGAQLLLALAAGGAALAARPFIPALREHPELMWAGLLYALAEAINPAWYFQALERMVLVTVLEITTRILSAAGIFVFVHSPADAGRVLVLLSLAPLLSTVIMLSMAYRGVPFVVPGPALTGTALKLGWRTFLFRSAETLYSIANAFILGLFAPVAVVGYFASAEKISRAVVGLVNPIRQAVFPRVSHLFRTSPAQAARVARVAIFSSLLAGALLACGVFVLAPVAVRILLGDRFEPAVPVLRVLSILPLVTTTSAAIGYIWLLPAGKDRMLSRIVFAAGVFNVVLAAILAPRYAHMGMAWAVIATEVFVCAAMVAVLSLVPSCRLVSVQALRRDLRKLVRHAAIGWES